MFTARHLNAVHAEMLDAFDEVEGRDMTPEMVVVLVHEKLGKLFERKNGRFKAHLWDDPMKAKVDTLGIGRG